MSLHITAILLDHTVYVSNSANMFRPKLGHLQSLTNFKRKLGQKKKYIYDTKMMRNDYLHVALMLLDSWLERENDLL
jgi:hypothetical protein